MHRPGERVEWVERHENPGQERREGTQTDSLSPSRLPTELCLIVLDLCQDGDVLQTCSLVCQSWYAQVRARQWEKIIISISKEKSPTFARLLQSPFRSPLFTKAIRNVRIDGDDDQWRNVEDVLCLLVNASVNVDRLEIELFHKPGEQLYQIPLATLNITHLTLRCSWHTQSTPDEMIHAFKHVIVSLQSLETLAFVNLPSTIRYDEHRWDMDMRPISPHLKVLYWEFPGRGNSFAVERKIMRWVLRRDPPPKLETLSLIDRSVHPGDVGPILEHLLRNANIKHFTLALQYTRGEPVDALYTGCTFLDRPIY